MPPPLIEITHRKGIYLPEADLWLDPHFGVKRAFISHAHSDHVARHDLTFCSATTHRLMVARKSAKKSGVVISPSPGEVIEWEGWELRLLPAGHIIGSTMLHLTRQADGATLLYTGDYKLRPGLSCPSCEPLPADVLIMECTFGLPRYRFPPLTEVQAGIQTFVVETLAQGGVPVLQGYSLGKAQELLRALHGLDVPVMVHPSVALMTEVVRDEIGELPEWRLFDPLEARGHALVFPPGTKPAVSGCRFAMASGWALDASAKYRYRADALFPLSDHADHPELRETVDLVKPRRVWLVHGFTREFAAELRAEGIEAWSLERADQLEFAW